MAQRPIQVIPVQGAESPLFQAVSGLLIGLEEKRRMDEARRRQELADQAIANNEMQRQMQLEQAARTQAANTPLAKAPQVTVDDMAEQAGLDPMHHDVAQFAPAAAGGVSGIPPVQRDIMITLANGKKTPLRPMGMTPAPLKYEEEVRAGKIADISAASEASGAAIKVTPEMVASLPKNVQGLFPVGSMMDKSMAVQLLKPQKDLQYIQKTDSTGATVSGIFDKNTGETHWNPTPENGLAPADFIVGEEYLKTLTPARQNLIKAIGEGRQPMPAVGNRPNSPGYMLMQDVYRAFPETDQQLIKARYTARNDLARGASTSRGQAITSLNQLARHLDEALIASDHMDKDGWSTHDIETLNKLGLAALPKGKQSSVTAYTTAVAGVVNEYIKALSGGVPTDQERKAFEDVQNPALPKKNREAALDTMRKFAQARVNAQEDWYQGLFKKSSAEDDNALHLGPGWKYHPEQGWLMIPPNEQRAKAGKPEAPPKPGASDAAKPATAAKPAAATPASKPITTKAEYDALPSGTEFVDAQGKKWKKP